MIAQKKADSSNKYRSYVNDSERTADTTGRDSFGLFMRTIASHKLIALYRQKIHITQQIKERSTTIIKKHYGKNRKVFFLQKGEEKERDINSS